MSAAIPTLESLFGLEGKRFVVCGAGAGMGAASARAIRGLGADVLCVDRDPELAEAIADEIGGRWLAADLTTVEGAEEVGRAAEGTVDGLVDVIGGASRKTIDDLDPETWDRDFDVNLRHAYLLGREFAPRMADQEDGGTLIFIASVVTEYGTHVTPAYHAAKAALVSWVRSLAVTYGPSGVRANAVSPGVTKTARIEEHLKASATALDLVIKTTALKEFQVPEDVAGAVAFLAGPAARMITGETIAVDAGTKVRDPWYGDSQDESLV
ncbi:MAG: SDR family NAD(P)-dependent oxidoreductase [Solirubrobacterales bacterium]